MPSSPSGPGGCPGMPRVRATTRSPVGTICCSAIWAHRGGSKFLGSDFIFKRAFLFILAALMWIKPEDRLSPFPSIFEQTAQRPS